MNYISQHVSNSILDSEDENMAQWIQGKIVSKRRWTSLLFSLQFEADIAPFKAGQFLRVGMDIQDERIGRPYSLVNAPHERPFEIYFNVVPGGLLSTHLVTLKFDDNVWVYNEAHGFLILDDVPDVPELWLMSTNTAVGPFISMIKTTELWERFQHVVLIHAVRTEDELSYQVAIAQTQKEHPTQFHFVPFVSRETIPNTIHGRIPASIDDYQLEEHVGLSLNATRSHVMLCGNSGMIEDTSKVLAGRGMKRNRRHDPGHITTEKYY